MSLEQNQVPETDARLVTSGYGPACTQVKSLCPKIQKRATGTTSTYMDGGCF